MTSPNQKLMDHLLNDITETIKAIENLKEITPAKNAALLKSQVEVDRKLLETFEEFCESIQLPENSPISEEKKEFLSRAKSVEDEAEIVQKEISKAREKNKKKRRGTKEAKAGNTDQQKRERRKLFKTIGGDKKWIPL